MKLARLFNTPVPVSTRENVLSRETVAEAERGVPTVNSFVTVQSLASFPGATVIVAILTQAIRMSLGAGAQQSRLLPLVISLVVGAIIFLTSVNDKDSASRPKTASEWAVAAFIGLVNAIVLYMAAIGAIQTVTGNAPTPTAGS
jgi:hypothetical protein